VLTMSDAEQLRAVIQHELDRPCARLFVVPEIEAIATDVLQEFEDLGVKVVPTARAARLTMDREGIRRLVAEELQLPTSPYRFCDSQQELAEAAKALGLPCVVKPLMSSSGKGQSVIAESGDVAPAWEYAQSAGRVEGTRVICEAFVKFDYEITLLTVRHSGGTSFCAPIGHRQENGDYRESWQPAAIEESVLARCHEIAETVTTELGGYGIFGVELFVAAGEVLFSEVSPRPHDTGMVTLASQNLSEFALHVRAILGIAIHRGEIPIHSPAASAVILGSADLEGPVFSGIDNAIAVHSEVDVRLFGKPTSSDGRRLGVVISRADTVDAARTHAFAAAMRIRAIPQHR
jgi:phosphoribosylglycinamide formyltransferase 2